jgi:cardiolipin synthase
VGRFFDLPNVLSLARIPLGALVWIAPHEPLYVVPVLMVAAATDVLDGWAARRLRPSDPSERWSTGTWLDPVCDKLFVVSVLAATYVTYAPPVHLLLLLLAREILLVPAMIGYALVPGPWQGREQSAALPGKVTTVLQFAAVLALVVGVLPVFAVLAWSAGVVGLLSVAHYVSRARALRGARP